MIFHCIYFTNITGISNFTYTEKSSEKDSTTEKLKSVLKQSLEKLRVDFSVI